MTRSLQVFAAERAMKRIQDNGLKPDDIKMILLSPFGLVMAYSIVKLSGKRKARTGGS